MEPEGSPRDGEQAAPPLVYDRRTARLLVRGRAEPITDQCVIDGKSFFPRGNLEIPLLGSHEKLVRGV